MVAAGLAGPASADVVLNGITYVTTDPGDATSGLVETDDGALTFLAQYDAGSEGQSQQNAAVEAYLNSIGVTGAVYLGGSPDRTGGPAGTSVTGGSGGLSGTWTFNPGSTGDVATFIVLHSGAGAGTTNDLYAINTPGLTGPWDTSEFFNKNGGQTGLSFLDLYGGAGAGACLLGCGGVTGNIPEPASSGLLGVGLLALGLLARRLKKI